MLRHPLSSLRLRESFQHDEVPPPKLPSSSTEVHQLVTGAAIGGAAASAAGFFLLTRKSFRSLHDDFTPITWTQRLGYLCFGGSLNFFFGTTLSLLASVSTSELYFHFRSRRVHRSLTEWKRRAIRAETSEEELLIIAEETEVRRKIKSLKYRTGILALLSGGVAGVAVAMMITKGIASVFKWRDI